MYLRANFSLHFGAKHFYHMNIFKRKSWYFLSIPLMEVAHQSLLWNAIFRIHLVIYGIFLKLSIIRCGVNLYLSA